MANTYFLSLEVDIGGMKYGVEHLIKPENLGNTYNTLAEALEAFPIKIERIVRDGIQKGSNFEHDDFERYTGGISEEDYIGTLMGFIPEGNNEGIGEILKELNGKFNYKIKALGPIPIH